MTAFPTTAQRGNIILALDRLRPPGQVLRPRPAKTTDGVRMEKTIQHDGKTFYSEAEVRRLVAQAFKESASIIHSAFSFPVAHLRCTLRAKEIEAGGPFAAPPHQHARQA